MDLPDIYFAFNWHPAQRPLLFHREPSGRIGNLTAAQAVPGQASLLIHGPGTPAWDLDDLELLARVRDGGGAVLPLSAIMERCGFPSRIRREDLLERLGGSHIDVEDPRREGSEILKRLAEILLDLDKVEETTSEIAPRPRALLVSDISSAPDAPGIYSFVSSEGQAIYIGKARSLRRRLASHFRSQGGEPAKRAALVAGATAVRWEEAGSELEALLREQVALRRERPSINVQRVAHHRPRGAWRDRAVALLLPSSKDGYNEVVLVAGDGRFHSERVPRAPRLPRGFWKRVSAFLEGQSPGRGPGSAKLTEDEQAELAEIALSWIVRHEVEVNQIDLTHEMPSPELKRRFEAWLGLDPGGERIEVR